jgi:hypothetical protein
MRGSERLLTSDDRLLARDVQASHVAHLLSDGGRKVNDVCRSWHVWWLDDLERHADLIEDLSNCRTSFGATIPALRRPK